ncbi:MAG: molybdopterin-dependent oxidoreductase, partial [Geopsychrobacter sp.]|nr:molybdopterin-dependent oxidoreductase [Geopsychrobacter sp.]
PHARTLLHKPGLEVNILNAMCRFLLDEGLAKTEGLQGVEELKVALTDYGVDAVAAATGVDAEGIKQSARELATVENAAILLAYGLPYTAHSRELGTAVANLSLLTGIAGRSGSGLYLCGEKSNSQGAIDLQILPAAGALGAVEMLKTAADGTLKALYITGEDLLVSYPDKDLAEKALDKTGFVVVQDLFLSETARKADVVLPAASFAEKNGTVTNAERRIQRLNQGITSPGEAKTDFAIFQALLAGLGVTVPADEALTFAQLAAVTPGYEMVSLEMIGPQGYVWGSDNLAPETRNLVAVEGGKALDAKYQLVVGSALYHSGTTSLHAKGPIAVVAEPYIEFGREDAQELAIVDGDLVKLKAGGTEISAVAKVDRRLSKGVLFAPYHFGSLGLNRIYSGQAAIAVDVSK